MTDRPIVQNAPGLVWRRQSGGWEAIWRARADLVERGYTLKNQRVWFGEELGERDADRISDACRRLQDEMLVWGRGSAPKVLVYEGTLRSLVNCYQTDPDSPYRKRRYHSRRNTDAMLKRIVNQYGDQPLGRIGDTEPGINARLLLAWHREWSDGGVKVSIGHAFISQLRTLFGFGATLLEDPECERLSSVMHKMRFPSGKPRVAFLEAHHAEGVREKAHSYGYHSIALAQALQFDLILRQKDVIGEFVPTSEPGISDVIDPRKGKWLRGIRWSEIDDNFVLRHTTSKKSKYLEVDLKLAPMAMEEMAFKARVAVADLKRDMLPVSGPLVVSEVTCYPWLASEFRRKWRMCADAADVPKSIKNMDSRSGGITEASEVAREHVRVAATHSDLAQTNDYSRAVREGADATLIGRVAKRKSRQKPDQNG